MAKTGRIESFFGVQDMTVGDPMQKLVQFSIPLLIGNLAQQLYNTVDSIVVGQVIGDVALASVGTAGPILNLLLVLFMGISTGAGILSSQFFGARDRDRLSRTVGSTILLTLFSGLLVMAAGFFLSPVMIALLKPPADVGAGAVIYLQIIFLGILGGAFYNILSGVLRGVGDSFYPLIFLVIGSVLNIVLDLLFVASFGFGIAGVAWATSLSQILTGLLCLIRLLSMKDLLDINRQTLRIDRELSLLLARLGIPSGITQALFSLSSILVQSLCNSLGTSVIAANVAIMRVDGFAMMPNFTFGIAATTYVGQNIGAGKDLRARQGVRDLLKLAMGVSLFLVLLILFFGRNLMSLFTDTEEVIFIGVEGLRWLAAGYLAFAVMNTLHGAMRGAGQTMVPMWLSLLDTLGLRLPLAYLLAHLSRNETWPNGQPFSLFASLLIAWCIGTVLTVFLYRKLSWQEIAPAGGKGSRHKR